MSFVGLRVALVGPLPPPAGGMANQTRQLSELLRGEGAEVELVQTNAAYRPAWVGGLRGIRAGARLLPYLWRLWRAAGRCELMHVMANSGWSWHLFAVSAIWIARWRGVPVVVNYRGGEADVFLSRSAAQVRFSMRAVARLVVPSGFLEKVFAGHGMPASIVPNIVDVARFRPDIRGGAHAPPDIVVARNLEPIYDNATALRAFSRLLRRHPMATLTIAGTGPLESELRRQAAELGVAERVRFTGRLDRDAMAQLLRQARVALNPSRVDNMPNSVLEALASGVPVVSTDVGGVSYIVQHDVTALLVPPGDDAAMADALDRLLHDDALASRLSASGLAEVQRYTWERVREQWLAEYRAALASEATRPVSSNEPLPVPDNRNKR
jgi:glycosyltransferase involved in cell wall biosynthesis